jgi:hypothetical protein
MTDCRVKAVATDEPHGVKRSPIGISAEGIDGHDARMLEVARDLCFQDKAAPAVVIIGTLALDLLEGDLTTKLLVARDELQGLPVTPQGRGELTGRFFRDRKEIPW